MASSSDKLFQKRKAKSKADNSRPKPTLIERRRALIVCEGEKTEPNYLRSLVDFLGLTTAHIEICGDCGSAPVSVVEHGIEKFDEDPDFELVFFVFDRDSHETYDDALSLVSKSKNLEKFKDKQVEAITSTPCFEIWYLLHIELHTRPYNSGGGKSPCGNLISVLQSKTGFEEYTKGSTGHFQLLCGRLQAAKVNSAMALRSSIEAGEQRHHGNSTTLMHELVNSLEEMANEIKPKK